MQLYSVEQKRSQALEAHAAAFSVLNQPGAAQSMVISFAQKTYNNGVLTSKLHVIELGAQAGDPSLHLYLLNRVTAPQLAVGSTLVNIGNLVSV